MAQFTDLRVGSVFDRDRPSGRRRGRQALRARRTRAALASALAALTLGALVLALPGSAERLQPESGRAIATVTEWGLHTAQVTYIQLVHDANRRDALLRNRDEMTASDFTAARIGIEQRIVSEEALLGRVGAALTTLGGMRDEWFHLYGGSSTSPILGPAKLTAEEMAAFVRSTGAQVRTSVPLIDLVRMFLEEGAREGVRGDVAFAQAIKETGDFSSHDTVINNFAGLGHCSACPKGDGFATARDGVRAQIQLLRWLADPTLHSIADFAAQPATVPLHFLHNAHTHPTWQSLGGLWAPNPQYGDSIYALFLRMHAFAVQYDSGLHS